MKINPINLNFNLASPQKAPSFRGVHDDEFELTDKVDVGFLRHTSRFFRYPETETYVKDYIKENFKDGKVNVLSAGCSYGEEVYSYAMMLRDLPNEVSVYGCDLSEDAIKGAIKGTYLPNETELSMLIKEDKDVILRRFEKDARKAFRENFSCTKDEEGTVVVQKNPDKFSNCFFKQGNLLDLDKMYKKGGMNVVLCRNVLYHFWDLNEKDGNTGKALDLMYDMLTPGGLFVLGEFEIQLEPSFMVALKKAGFIPLDAKCHNVWKKPENGFEKLKYKTKEVLNKIYNQN